MIFIKVKNVGAYFQARTFITGFDGSAGTAIITLDHAGLWTDGRISYRPSNSFQALRLLSIACWNQVSRVSNEFLEKHLPEHGTIGFDGRVISMKNGKAYQEIAEKKHGHIVTSEDLIDLIWKDRPALSTKPAFAWN